MANGLCILPSSMLTDFFECLYSYLTKCSSIKNVFSGRVVPLLAKDVTEYHILIYSPIGVTYDKNLQKESGFTRQKVQFTVVANSFGKSRTAIQTVRAVFKDFKGNMEGIEIQATHFESSDMEIVEENEYMTMLELEFMY